MINIVKHSYETREATLYKIQWTEDGKSSLLHNVALWYVNTRVMVDQMRVGQDELNGRVGVSDSRIPPILPFNIANMSVIDYSDILNGVFKERLDHPYSPQELDELLQQFKSF
jgi:hypothetical protein